MRVPIVIASIISAVSALNLRMQETTGDVNYDDDAPTPKPFLYSPSNKNTRAPKTFADEIVADESYHELVPALQVLADLTTAAPSL